MALETHPFDPARYLDTPEGVQAYLADAFAEGDPAGIADALGVVARAHGMSQLAEDTGLTRPALYKALSADGNPTLATLVGVLKAFGLRITVQADKAA